MWCQQEGESGQRDEVEYERSSNEFAQKSDWNLAGTEMYAKVCSLVVQATIALSVKERVRIGMKWASSNYYVMGNRPQPMNMTMVTSLKVIRC